VIRRLGTVLVALLVVPGCLVVALSCVALVALPFVAWQLHQLVGRVDEKWSPSWASLLWGRFWGVVYGVPASFQLGIQHNEGASTPRPPTDAEAALWSDAGQPVPELVYPVGDLEVANGPSFSPGQVERVNILNLWAAAPWYLRWLVVKSDPRDLALPGNESAAMWAAMKMMQQALSTASGDHHEAAAVYNGGPHHSSDAAETYADNEVQAETAELSS